MNVIESLNYRVKKAFMRIWIVTVGEPLPSDGPDQRLHRSGLLAEVLVSRGHEVLWWSSTFDHARKRFRGGRESGFAVPGGARIRLLHGPAYRRNVSVSRLVNHHAIGRRFREQAPSEARPDLILASWPTIELARESIAYGRASGVPVVLDVRDLWPDIFVELAPPRARDLARLAVSGMTRAAGQAFGDATAITGVTPAFVAWGLHHAGRPASEADRAFPLGYSDRIPDTRAIAKASTFWDGMSVGRDGEFVAAFVGTMGLQKLDMAPLVAAARAFRGENVQFVLCGDGDGLAAFRAMAAGLDNVVFPGHVGWAEIWTLLRRASVGLAPYGRSLNYTNNLPNKPIEYLSAGLPILSSLDGTLRALLSRHGCGLTYDTADELISTLSTLRAEPRRREAMSVAALALFRAEFVAENVYGEMADHLESFASGRPRRMAISPHEKAVTSC